MAADDDDPRTRTNSGVVSGPGPVAESPRRGHHDEAVGRAEEEDRSGAGTEHEGDEENDQGSGSGSEQARWGCLVVWADDRGIKIYDLLHLFSALSESHSSSSSTYPFSSANGQPATGAVIASIAPTTNASLSSPLLSLSP
jgi:hypothetical protein